MSLRCRGILSGLLAYPACSLALALYMYRTSRSIATIRSLTLSLVGCANSSDWYCLQYLEHDRLAAHRPRPACSFPLSRIDLTSVHIYAGRSCTFISAKQQNGTKFDDLQLLPEILDRICFDLADFERFATGLMVSCYREDLYS